VTTVPFPQGIKRPAFNFLWVTSSIFRSCAGKQK
jgi:hypothetical protein